MSYKETATEYIKDIAQEVNFALTIGIGMTAVMLTTRQSDWDAAREKEAQAYAAKDNFEETAGESGQIASQTPGWRELDDAAQKATRDRLDAEDALEAEQDG